LNDNNQPADKRVPTFKQTASHLSLWGASAPLFYVLQSVNGVRHFGWNPDNFIYILPDLEPYIYWRLIFSIKQAAPALTGAAVSSLVARRLPYNYLCSIGFHVFRLTGWQKRTPLQNNVRELSPPDTRLNCYFSLKNRPQGFGMRPALRAAPLTLRTPDGKKGKRVKEKRVRKSTL
jgi:hypothetical protein